MNNLINKIGIDKAIAYVLIGRGWSVISGVFLLYLISVFLSPEYQGYYFTFSSLISLQVFFELGLGTILSQFVSHEMGRLTYENGCLVGEEKSRERLLSIVKLSLKWYLFVAVGILIFISIFGLFFFSSYSAKDSDQVVNWVFPWLFLVLTSAIGLYLSPLIAIAEGCGLVVRVNKMRIYQLLFSSAFAWGCLISGFGLYSTSASALSIIIVGGLWLNRNFKNIIISAVKLKKNKNEISWKKEMLPMQWRVAVSWISGYFILQFMNPVAFKFYGAEFAGQLGLSLTIGTLMLNLAMAWINTKIPFWGRLISLHNYQDLILSYKKAFRQSCVFFCILISLAMIVIYILTRLEIDIVSRVLSLESFFVMCLCMLGNHIVSCQATYIRTHKIELYTPLSIMTALLLSCTMYLVTKYLPPNYMIIGYCIVVWLFFVPYSSLLYIKFTKKKVS